jgi:hypothetical protein
MIKQNPGEFERYYKDIFLKYNTYKKNSRLMPIISITSFILFFVVIWLKDILYEYGFNKHHIYIFLITITVLLFFSSWYLGKKQKKYFLNSEQISFIYTYRAVENLEKYLETQNKKYKNELSSNLYKLYVMINEWNVGNLYSLKKILGISLSEFIKNFNTNIFLIIKKDNHDELKRLLTFLYSFLIFLKKDEKTINNFSKIFKKFEELKEIKSTELKITDKFFNLLKTYEQKIFFSFEEAVRLKYIFFHLGMIIGCIIIVISVYVVGIYVIGTDENAAYSSSMTVLAAFIALFAIYLNKKSTQPK